MVDRPSSTPSRPPDKGRFLVSLAAYHPYRVIARLCEAISETVSQASLFKNPPFWIKTLMIANFFFFEQPLTCFLLDPIARIFQRLLRKASQ
jgi:hypothetical protein